MPAKIIVTCQQVSPQLKFESGAWVGLFRNDKDSDLISHIDNKNYHAFEWIMSGKEVLSKPLEDKKLFLVEREISFEVPKAGKWHLRLFSDRSYNDVASDVINIPGNNRLVLTVLEKDMKVDCYVNTVDLLRDYVWVGIYKTDEKDQRQYRRYKYLIPTPTSSSSSMTTPSSAPISTLTFRTPVHSGVYEARLFANKSYEVLSKSESVTIHGI